MFRFNKCMSVSSGLGCALGKFTRFAVWFFCLLVCCCVFLLLLFFVVVFFFFWWGAKKEESYDTVNSDSCGKRGVVFIRYCSNTKGTI